MTDDFHARKMRIKPRAEWHNFGFSYEKDLGELEIAISLNAFVARRFANYLADRIKRNTGIRFKFTAKAAQEIVEKSEGLSLCYQLYSKDGGGYVFPNESPHTKEYNSPYNRVELYIPVERVLSEKDLQRLSAGEKVEQLELLFEEAGND